MITSIKTIWKYGIVFLDTQEETRKFAFNTHATVIYQGETKKMPKSIAETVAEIHPKYETYYDEAMMTLYKTYGKRKNGTEDPILAIETLKSGKELLQTLPYIVIWKIL